MMGLEVRETEKLKSIFRFTAIRYSTQMIEALNQIVLNWMHYFQIIKSLLIQLLDGSSSKIVSHFNFSKISVKHLCVLKNPKPLKEKWTLI